MPLYLSYLFFFSIYDLNHDGVLNKDDIDVLINIIYEYTEHKITYYVSSNITIHMNDHTLGKDSITDIIEYK